MSQSNNNSRRDFLRQSAGLGAGAVLAGSRNLFSEKSSGYGKGPYPTEGMAGGAPYKRDPDCGAFWISHQSAAGFRKQGFQRLRCGLLGGCYGNLRSSFSQASDPVRAEQS